VKVRKIDIDFSTAKVYWTPATPEFAQFWNATSSYLPYLEPYLNRVVREGMNRLPESESQLREDCKIFVAQETQHYKNHAKFNRMLRESGYRDLADREAVMKADYERFFKEKDLRWNLGYAEGFETLGPILACYFLESAKELQAPDVDDPTADLWRWHLAEEYEHRHVCNYIYDAVTPGYWWRLYGIWYAGRHMFAYMIRTTLYLLEEDYRAARIPDRAKSRLRLAAAGGRMLKYVLPRVIKTMHPKYDPINIPVPERSMEVLAETERQWAKQTGE
jgi:predicted metal-dependent hydrolase